MSQFAQPPLKLAVLISGGGTTLRNLISRIADGKLNAQIVLVISSNPTAAGLRYAEDAQIPHLVSEQKNSPTPADYQAAVFGPIRSAGVDLVVMAGFLKHVPIPADFANRVVNIHPALLPAFGGKGMYGKHVHTAVLESGSRTSGCTVHWVDDEYDHGEIILQKIVPVMDDDTPESLAARVFTAECEAFPEAINQIASNKIPTFSGRATPSA